MDLGLGYKMTCRELDQDHAYIILYKFSKFLIPIFFIEEN
jgi:hypothetical protein